jgi:hypothetical protein
MYVPLRCFSYHDKMKNHIACVIYAMTNIAKITQKVAIVLSCGTRTTTHMQITITMVLYLVPA